MDRRAFARQTMITVSGVLLLDLLHVHKLFARPHEQHLNKWLLSVHEQCNDLRTGKLSVVDWQQKISELHNSIGTEDLEKLIDFHKLSAQMSLPHLGVDTRNTTLPKIEGITDNYSFIGRIFGMQKDRAIIPHGHRNMVSCHRIIKGEFMLRQYDRIDDDADHMRIRQTIDAYVKPGSHSSISDEQNNVHWLIAKTGPAFTFDVIVAGLDEQKDVEIDNLDIDTAVKEKDDIFLVKKIKVGVALEKYGYDTHH